MKFQLLVLPLALLLLAIPCGVLFAASPQDPSIQTPGIETPGIKGPADDAVLASFRETVTATELRSWRRSFPDLVTEDRQLDLRQLIFTKALATEAERLGLANRPEVEFEIEHAQAAAMEPILRRSVRTSVKPSDAEAEAKYQEIKDTFTLPRRSRLRNLYRWIPPEADDEARAAARAELQRIRSRVLEGESFANLASELSDSQTRLQKGLIGNVSAGMLPGKIDALVMAMEPGEVSKIVEGPEGLTLFYCEKIIPKVERSAEELRHIARQRLANRAFKKAWDSLRQSWLDSAGIQYRWQSLEARPKDPTPEGSEVLVEWAEGALTVEHMQKLLGKPASSVKRSVIENKVEAWVFSRALLKEVRRRNLLTPEDFDRLLWLRRQALERRAILYHVEARFPPLREGEIREYFEQNQGEFQRPKHLELSLILLPASSAEASVQDRLHKGYRLVRRLEAGEITFEQAAREVSVHASAKQGGRVGWVSLRALTRRYGLKARQAIQRLEPGKNSGLVQAGEKFYVFRLLAVEKSRPKSFAEARRQAEDRLGSERANAISAEVRNQWLESLSISDSTHGSP